MESVQEINICDPIEFFPLEVSFKIFNFLEAKDLLQASEVSTSWYDFIGGSKTYMDKIKVTIRCTMNRDIHYDFISPLANSTRRYQHLSLSICSYCIEAVKPTMEAHKGKWRTVKIMRTNFQTPTEVLDYLECFECSVEELIMTEVCTRYPYSDGIKRYFSFPKLKIFHARHIQVTLFSDAFENLANLEELVLCSHTQTLVSLTSIMILLQNNVNLKTLTITNNVFSQIMYQKSVVDLPFKLKKLSVDAFYSQSLFVDQIQQNFSKFLVRQKRLEKLEFNDWMGIKTTTTAFGLPKLRELTLKGISKALEPIDWDFVNIPVNRSIFKLAIHVPKNHPIFEKIMKATPNVTCFTASYIGFDMLTHLAKSHPNLCCLSIGTFDILEVFDKEIFKKLDRLVILQYKVTLEVIIKKKRTDEKSHFEKKIESLF